MAKLYVRDSFIESFDELPEMYRQDVREALIEFHTGKLMKSRHPEKLPAYGGFYSLRADHRYRIIMLKIAPATFVLLLVGPHDVIYDWAEKNKKQAGNMSTDPADYAPLTEAMPELFEKVDAVTPVTPDPIEETQPDLFYAFPNRILLKGLQNAEELSIIRNCKTEDDFALSKEKLSLNSIRFLEFLYNGSTIDEALHEVYLLNQNQQEHEAFEQAMEKIRNIFKDTYRKSRFPHISGENGKFNLLCGPCGTGKTIELLNVMEHSEEIISKKDRILFLVSNPDYLADMKSYIRIVISQKILTRVDILDFQGLVRHIINDCRDRWGLDFEAFEINENDDLLDLLREAADSVEDSEFEIWDYMRDWMYVIENYGCFTKEDYFETPRIGCVNITAEQQEKVWEVFEKFIAMMEEKKMYSIGYAIYKLMPLIKRKNYKAYGLVLADDIQYLSYLKIDFLNLIRKSHKSAFSVDVNQDRYFHHMSDLTNPECSEGNIFLGFTNFRLDSEKLKYTVGISSLRVTSKSMSQKGLQIIDVESCDVGNEDAGEKLCDLIRGFDKPEENAVIVPDMLEAEDYHIFLEENGIKSVIIDDSQSYFDYLLDEGIRIIPFHRVGCLTFENVIIPNTYAGVADVDMNTGINLPLRYWYFSFDSTLSYKMTLFTRGIAASREVTYVFRPGDGDNLIDLIEDNRE